MPVVSRGAYLIYIIAFFVMLVVPLIGLAVPAAEDDISQAEKRDLAPLPTLMDENGALNVSCLGGLGAWFEDHFGFRNCLITAHGLVEQAGLGSAAGDEVIVGRDGWLYYRGTLSDFLGRPIMSERELYDAAHNVRLMQEYVQREGCTFLFAVVPNKNSIYPQHMPANYLKGGASNALLLQPYMDAEGILFLDLREPLLEQHQTVYFERDTHWNGKGALIGYNEIMDALGLSHNSYAELRWLARADHRGDLDEMLLPSAWTEETEYYLDTSFTYSYRTPPDSLRDPLIETRCDTGQGRLYMFRDSFADALIPLFSQHFRTAVYSMYTPWNLPEAAKERGTDIVIELVERNLTDLLNRPAILPAPERQIVVSGQKKMAASARAVRDGPYIRISGRVEAGTLEPSSQIAVRAGSVDEMRTYEPFYTSNEERTGNSFCMYVPSSGAEQTIYVEICTGAAFEKMHAVYSGEIRIESGGENS